MRSQFNHIHFNPLLLAALLLLLWFSHAAYSADISRDIREGREDESLEHGGYFEFSLSSILNQMPIPGSDELVGTIGIGGHYRYKRFFIDAHAESYNQFQFGLNAYSGDIWSVDFLTATSEHGVDSELNAELKLFTEREAASYLGVRATGYNGPYLLQFESLWDISELHYGTLLTASFARTWLYRNWNFHALLGARFETERALDYQFGIDADEATLAYPEYQAGSGTTFVTEAGVTYPLNQYLILKSTFRWWELPSAVVGSPFITDDSYLTFSNSITFVY